MSWTTETTDTRLHCSPKNNHAHQQFCQGTQENPEFLFYDGAVTNIGLGKKYMDGSVLLIYDIHGGVIPEGAKGNLLKYKVDGFDEEEEKFTLAYSAQAIEENEFIWIYFPDY